MAPQLLPTLANIAGIAGLGLGIFYLLFKHAISQVLTNRFTKRQSFILILIFMLLVWGMMFFCVYAWIYVIPQRNQDIESTQGVIDDIQSRRFLSVYAKLDDANQKILSPEYLESVWDKYRTTAGEVTTISQPVISSFKGKPAFASTYYGTTGQFTIYVRFDENRRISLLWYTPGTDKKVADEAINTRTRGGRGALYNGCANGQPVNIFVCSGTGNPEKGTSITIEPGQTRYLEVDQGATYRYNCDGPVSTGCPSKNAWIPLVD